MRFGSALLLAAVALAGCGGGPAEPDPQALLDVRLGLARDQDGLAAAAFQVNDPASKRYGRFLTRRLIGSQFGASPKVRAAVVGLLRRHGIAARIDATGGLVEARMTQSQARKLLGVHFSRGTLEDGSSFLAPRSSAKVPGGLRGLVREVVGLARSSPPEPAGEAEPRAELDRAACGRAKQESAIILRRYGISALAESGSRGQGMTVAVTAVDAFDPRALVVWAQCLGVRAPAVHAAGRPVERVRLGSDHELELDLDTLVAAAPRLAGIETIAFDPVGWAGEPFLAALEREAGPPDVISSSETYCESALTRDDRDLAEWVLASAAATGVTVVVAAGDTGSSGCYPDDKRLAVDYPASSPFVTAVGGTQLEPKREAIWYDAAAAQAGGGGSSAALARPPYQVSKATHRVLPDVAYVADPSAWPEIPVCDHSKGTCEWAAIGGTSASAPLFAAGAALVKQVVRAAGRVEPGLFNPLLYGYAAQAPKREVVDVVDGTNDLFGAGCCPASPGYDAASGWGAVNFAALARLTRSAARRSR